MKRLISFPAIMSLLFTYCTSVPVYEDEAKTGIITGSVMVDSTYVEGIIVSLAGTNMWAVTDSMGQFRISNIVPGNYILNVNLSFSYSDTTCSDTAFPIEVPLQDTLSLAPVQLRQHLPPDYLVIRKLVVFSGSYLDSVNDFNWKIYEGSSESIYVQGDTLRLVFDIRDIAGAPVQTNVTVLCGSDTLFDTIAGKGIVRTPWFTIAKTDTLSISIGNRSPSFLFLLQPEATRISNNSLFITTPAPVLMPFSNPAGTSRISLKPNERIISIGSDTMIGTFQTWEVIDWDLYLVNDSTGDTCSWRSTEYSRTGGAVFDGDAIDFARANIAPAPVDYEIYEPDRISGSPMSNGSYTLLVHFYKGPPDSSSATPSVYIETGFQYITENKLLIRNGCCLKPSAPLKPGDIWRAGRIRYPEGDVDTAGQWVKPGSAIFK